MAMALIAWFRAPAPITWTSTLPIWRTTPASAPATELGLDREDTFRTSMAEPFLWGAFRSGYFRAGCPDPPERAPTPYGLPDLHSTIPAVRPASTPLRRYSQLGN